MHVVFQSEKLLPPPIFAHVCIFLPKRSLKNLPPPMLAHVWIFHQSDSERIGGV